AALLCAFISPESELLLYGGVALFAGLSLAHFGLCLAVANDRLEPEEMVSAGATLTICYGVGSILGPIIVTEAIEFWQATAYFFFLAGVHMVVICYALAVILQTTATDRRRQPAAAVTSHAGTLATSLALQTARQLNPDTWAEVSQSQEKSSQGDG
ncbi:MAG: hypothetical protein AAF530_19720, partial [Pseudomonadota bacterium]